MNKYIRVLFFSCCLFFIIIDVGCAFNQNQSKAEINSLEAHKSIMDKAENRFTYISKKSIFFSGKKTIMQEGNTYSGIPYTSRWKNSHFIGFEISPETALNAVNDEYSIWYDDGIDSNQSEINTRRLGPGYGLVCSAYVSLLLGNPYPQTNYGMLLDNNFITVKGDKLNLVKGNYYMHNSYGHSIYIKDVTNTNYIVSECTTPGVQQTTHNKLVNKLTNYWIKVDNIDKSGYSKSYLDFDNIKIADGSVRPWRGNKAVYGNWDKKHSRVLLTIHGEVKKVFVKTPDGDVKAFDIAAKQKYLDVTECINMNGEYELSSDISSTKEYFRYFNSPLVELGFLDDSTAVFSDPKIDYCYILYLREDGKKWPVVVAKGVKYPELARNKAKITSVYAAMQRDPSTDSWGRFSSLCRLKP